ncbi:enoyl-CoA hydratase/isomerase family protein [Natronomonas sp.]|uniref:enoyl-CoA hydratase/isomerase family protein n=1 Tax=Natronomonas sp. TaxID=2184060 RepID=UPI0039762E8C
MTIAVPETIDFGVDDGVATVTIDRPPVNALRSEEYVEYAAFFDALSEHDEAQVVVIETAGEDRFLAGHDVNEFVELTPETARTLTERARAFFRAIDEVAWPTIAAVDGYALGTGLAVTAVTDLRYATADAEFGLPEVDRGVLGGYKFAQRHLPEGRARELFFTGDTITGETACEEGYVQACFETRAELHEAVAETAATIAEKNRETIRLAKASVIETVDMETHAGYERECAYTVELRGDEGARRSSAAFFDE